MKFTTLLFLITLCVPLSLFAQREIIVPAADGEAASTFLVNTPDPDMRRIPTEITSLRQTKQLEFIQMLAQYINEKADGDFDKVKKAHDWVALNIRYDTESYFSGHHSSQTFDAVIRRGSAVCAGYADVFKHLCDALEIECEIVSGFSRGYGRDLFRSVDVTNTNHAWNIVAIEGKKYLIDTTWDAGGLIGRKFQARYKTDYFFTDPAVFIYYHFPADSAYQLIEPPLSAEEFNALPFLDPQFFMAFETWPQLERITEINSGEEYQFEVTVRPEYEFSCYWRRNTGAMLKSFYPSKADTYVITIPKQNPGRYILDLSIKAEDGRYWRCAEFGFIVK